MAGRASKIPKHEHDFAGGQYCACGAVCMPYSEFLMWSGEWDNYYEKVKGTRSKQIYHEMLRAVKENKKEEVIRLREEAKLINDEAKTEIPKPILPDPRNLQVSGMCVII